MASAGQGCKLRVMTRLDPLAAGAEAKRTAALLRDARAVLRHLDVLAATAIAADDRSVLLIAQARRRCHAMPPRWPR